MMFDASPDARWRGVFLRGFVLLCLLTVLGQARAEVPVIRIGDEPRLEFSRSAVILADDTGTLSIDRIVGSAAEFRQVTPKDLARRYDARTFWLRAVLHNATDQRIERWLAVGHPRIESATLYQAENGGWTRVEAGLRIAPRDKPAINGVVFPMVLGPGEAREVVLRLSSHTVLDVNATLWAPVSFLQQEDTRQLVVAAGFGGSVIIAFLSLSIFVRLREASYLYFAGLHLFGGLIELNREGLLERFLWPASVPVPLEFHMLLSLVTILSLVSIQRSFFDLKRAHPRWDLVFIGIAVISVAASPLAFFRYDLWIRTAAFLTAVNCLLAPLVGVVAFARGNRVAGYMAVAFAVFWLAEALRQVSSLGLLQIPVTHSLSSTWALLISAPMFFIALVERSRQLGDQLRRSQEISKAKSEFLARVSHELHAPLNTIIGYARLLGRASPRLTPEEGARDIERSGVRLLGMIDELLDQSRLESGALLLRPRPVALVPWLQEIDRACTVEAEAAGNVFALVLDRHLPAAVQMDPERLRQVIDNLTSNANRHTRQGRIELRCRVASAAGAQRVRLSFAVADTGHGMTPSTLAQVFERFYQGPELPGTGARRRPGIGLGLSIAGDLVTLMGGRLTAASQPGAGSTFSFELECALAEVPEPSAQVAPPVHTAAEAPAGLRVLLVDDDSEALRLLDETLRALGCESTQAESGSAAISALMKRPSHWDLVITDQRMADGDGWTVLRFARQQYPGLPVVLISATEQQAPSDLPAGMVFDGVLGKPLDAAALARLLQTLPARRQSWARPDAAKLAELRRLAELGEVSAMEDWCAALEAGQPEFSRWARQVGEAVQRLDFERVIGLTDERG